MPAAPENTDTGAMGLTVGAVAPLIVIGALLAALAPAQVVTVSVAVARVCPPTTGAVYTGLGMVGLLSVPTSTVHAYDRIGSVATPLPFRVTEPPEATV